MDKQALKAVYNTLYEAYQKFTSKEDYKGVFYIEDNNGNFFQSYVRDEKFECGMQLEIRFRRPIKVENAEIQNLKMIIPCNEQWSYEEKRSLIVKAACKFTDFCTNFHIITPTGEIWFFERYTAAHGGDESYEAPSNPVSFTESKFGTIDAEFNFLD